MSCVDYNMAFDFGEAGTQKAQQFSIWFYGIMDGDMGS
jgi:hypothetical protein